MQHLFPAIVYLNLKAELTHTPFFFFFSKAMGSAQRGMLGNQGGGGGGGGERKGQQRQLLCALAQCFRKVLLHLIIPKACFI